MAAKQFGDFYTHTLLIEQSTVRWVACLTMNKMSGADMNREIIIYNEHVKRTLIWLNFVTYIYNVHCAKHFGANSKNDVCFCWVRYKSLIYILNSPFIADPFLVSFRYIYKIVCARRICTPTQVSLKMIGTAQAYLYRYLHECTERMLMPYTRR